MKANQLLPSDFQKAFQYPPALEIAVQAEMLWQPQMLQAISITVTGTAHTFSDTSEDCGQCRSNATSFSAPCAKHSACLHGKPKLLSLHCLPMSDVFQAPGNY